MPRERFFTRDDKTMSTRVPAAATQLLAEGWTEVPSYPTERPEPEGTEAEANFAVADGKVQSRTEYGQDTGPTGIPTVDQDSRIATGRRARRGDAETPAEG